MATQTVTMQVDQAMAEVAHAFTAAAERAGKSTTELLAHMKMTGEPIVLKISGYGEFMLVEARGYKRLVESARHLRATLLPNEL